MAKGIVATGELHVPCQVTCELTRRLNEGHMPVYDLSIRDDEHLTLGDNLTLILDDGRKLDFIITERFPLQVKATGAIYE